MNIQCLKCKGRGYCGRAFCAQQAKLQSMSKVDLEREEFTGSSPAPFVGHYGYPYVNVGILAPPEVKDTWVYDAPKHWSSAGFDIRQIMDLRSALVNSRFKADVHSSSRFLEVSQEVGMASRPVDVEIGLSQKPKFRMQSADTAPMGPMGELKKVDVVSNPKVHTKVDRVVSDTDMKAADAIGYLYKNYFDENFLTRLMSVGNLGVKRKLVPTRWSITAVDDMLAKRLHDEIVDYESVDDWLAFFGSYLGNYYLVMMIPDVWCYELFETTPDSSEFMTDHEGYYGRKDYAESCAGGYYSVRLAVLEKLKSMKRQAGVLVLRVITGEYAVPLGVWVTREAARKALSEKPLRFSSLELLLKYAKALCKKKFGMEAKLLDSSKVLKEVTQQRKLGEFS
ncbi:hypothetical protein JXB31_05235 [Candidatus Woesearchaeota archaeon]|nr:hypothetical protein [Candidatus Woesearchaeota archaeon]